MIYDLRKKQTGTTINNQDKTVSTNGTVTADDGYTGLGTVTVNVSNPVKALKITNLGCTISEDAVASDFHGYNNDSTNIYGGFTYGSGGRFLNDLFTHQHFVGFQIKFKTPTTKQSTVLCQGANSGGNALALSLDADFTYIHISTYNYTNKNANFAFDTDTWYIVRYCQKWTSADSWKVITSISADDGQTFTDIKTESGRLDSDTYGIAYYMADTQFGYLKNQVCDLEIDLKKTGFIDNTTNITYMFADAA